MIQLTRDVQSLMGSIFKQHFPNSYVPVETTFAYVRHQDAHPQSSPRVAAGVRLVADRPLSQESVTRPPKPL